MSMCDSESDYDGAEAYIRERAMLRRRGKPFSTDIDGDEEYGLYEPLFQRVFNGASQLTLLCTGYNNTLEGQMGMVAFGDGPPSAVTALHNVVSRGHGTPFACSCTFSGKRHNMSFKVAFPQVGLPKSKIKPLTITSDETEVGWEYGVDIVRGQFPDPSPASAPDERFHVFQPVNEDYSYSVGTKVAMAIFTKQVATEATARIKEAGTVDLAKVYGPADEISIYTGVITELGGEYFVHDMNSYRGLSGAIVFILHGDDAGKCIGVHIGSPLDIEPSINVAIKIHESPTLRASPKKEGSPH